MVMNSIRQNIQYRPYILWTNGLSLVLLIGLSLYGILGDNGSLVKHLFFQLYNREEPFYGSLATFPNLFLCVGMSVCAFAVALLRQIHPRRKLDLFILGCAILTGSVLFDRFFRLIITLYIHWKAAKVVMIFIYLATALIFWLCFRKRFVKTPYGFLAIALFCLVFGEGADLTKLKGVGVPAMFEGGGYFIASLNIGLYLWITCLQQIFQSLHRFFGIALGPELTSDPSSD